MLRTKEGDNLTRKKHGEIESCYDLLFFLKKKKNLLPFHSALAFCFNIFIVCVVFLCNFCSCCCSFLLKKIRKISFLGFCLDAEKIRWSLGKIYGEFESCYVLTFLMRRDYLMG